MMIQEPDIKIRHCPGKANLNANALPHNPGPALMLHSGEAVVLSVDSVSTGEPLLTVEAVLSFSQIEITEYQWKDPDLSQIIYYLEKDTLPQDERQAR